MGWSMSELARLTDTTVNTIRHYHKQDLLAEPERASNGSDQSVQLPENIIDFLQDLASHVPDLLHPLIIALAGALTFFAG